MLLHVLRHVDPDHRVLGIEHEFGERAGELGLADPGRTEEQEGADRTVGVLQSGARAPERAGDRLNGFVLTDDALMQPVLHVNELLDLALEHPRDRDPGPLADDLRDVVGVDVVLEELRRGTVLLGGLSHGELLLEVGDGAVLELGGAGEVRLALCALELDPRLIEPLSELGGGANRLLLSLPFGVHRGRALPLLGKRARELLAPGDRPGIVVVAQ